MIFLETDRLQLRNVAPKDRDIIYDYRNHPICAQYQRGQTKDPEGIAALIERRKADALGTASPCLLAVALKETDELVGEIVVMPVENTFSFGYTFSYRHHRKGYAFEALSVLMTELHERYSDWEFICFTDPENVASMALLKKLGYKDMGYLPAKDSQVFGKWITAETEAEIAAARRRGEESLMTLKEMIYKRKSCRSFLDRPVEDILIEQIKAYSMKPLYPDIKVHWEIVSRSQVRCICPWTTKQLIAVYAEEKDGYLENAGFLFQQLELYLQTLGMGVCWLGLGRMNPKNARQVPGMKFVIMLAFGYPKGEQLRGSLKEFKRKEIEKITDRADPKLECARLAPSAVNSQPWYFTHEGGVIRVYCNQIGTRLDAGIAMAHLYVENPETFRFHKEAVAPEIPDYDYIGSVSL